MSRLTVRLLFATLCALIIAGFSAGCDCKTITVERADVQVDAQADGHFGGCRCQPGEGCGLSVE